MKKIYSLIQFCLVAMVIFSSATTSLNAQCMDGTTEVTVTMTNETFAGENSWILWDATAGMTIAGVNSAPGAAGATACANTTATGGWINNQSVTACAIDGNVIELYTYESFGDGWQNGNLLVETTEDATGYVATACSPQNFELYNGDSPASDNDLTAGTGDGGINCAAIGAGELVASFTTVCISGCDIVCPADVIAENDQGVCMANVVLPPPTFDPMGCTIEQQADFETATTGDVDLTFVALTYAGDAITVPAGPTPASCVTEVPFTICWNTDNGGSAAGFESAEITFPAPLINPAVVANLNGQFPANGTTFPAGASGTDIAQGGPLPAATGMPVGNGDCTTACMDIVVSLADYANWNGGTFTIGADGGVNLFCAANTISISTTVATSCASYVVTGVPGFEPGASPASIAAGVDFPLGTTTVCYTATGSANGASFPISCKFDVTVNDTEAPVLTCPGDFTFNLQGGECCQIFEFEVSATDNCFMGDGFSTLTGPFCDPCADPTQGSALACPTGPNSVIQLIDNVFAGDSLTEVCFNQETFNTTTSGVINVYCYDGVNIPFDDGAGTFVPFASADLTLNDANSGTCVCTPFESIVVPAGCTTIAIEVFNAVGRSVQTPANCDGEMATGMNTYLRAPVCGAAVPTLFNTIGFSLDAGFNATFRSAELVSIDNNATPGNPGFDTFNEFESGDELPIGIHCFAYVATDRAGNVSNCDFCITVNGVPESQIVNSLTCNNSVNLSLDENCQAFISADMFLEGGPYGCYFDCYEVYITDEFGNNVVSGCGDAATKVPGGDPVFPNTDVNDVNGCVIDIPCGEYTVMVYDRCNDNTCWGNLVVEDKIAPIVIAPIDITLNCLMDTEPGENTVEGVEALSLVDEAFTFSDATTGLVYTSTQTLVPPVSGAVITDINVDVDFSHSWVNDLDIVLTGPNGATVFLTDSDCGTQDNILATFDEESGTAIGGCSGSFGTAPHEDCTVEQTSFTLNGSFETASFSNNGLGLDQWYGLPVSGDWTLEVFDNTGGDGGCLKELNMNFAYTAFTTGMPVIENGCGDETVTFQDEVFDNDCDGTIIVRTWTATDEKGNSGTAQNTILVEQIGLDAENIQWFYPEETVDLTCDACVTPECIYDFFRAQWIADNPPASPEVADSETYIASANAAGVRNAYPFFLNREGLQERFDINNCNLFFSFSDLVLPTCGPDCSGNSKIIRTWTVLDWCSGETSESVQVINAKDTEGPTIDLVESITVSASIHDCSANFILPTPEHLFDNCSSEVTYTVYGAPGTITDESASPFFSNGEWRVVGLPKTMEPATYTYAAEDCCGNVTLAILEVNVVDGTPPIAIGTQNIVINLTSSPTDPDGGLAKLFKESVDNGSHDGGCGPVRLAIRRTDAVTQTAARGGNINGCGSDGEIYNNAGDVWNNNSTFFNFNDVPVNSQPTDHSLFDTDNGDFVKFCCNDLASPNALTDANGMTYVIIEVELGVWDDANMDGIPGTPGDQFARTWVNVRVESKLEATIICPPLVKITCEMDETDLSITGTATGNATCGGLNTTFMDLCGLDINQDMEIDEFEGTGTINEVGMCYDVNGDGVIANFDGDGEDIGEDFFNKACHYGPITRYWTVEGTDIKCRQIIIIEEPAGVFAGNGLDLNDDGDCNDPGEICPVIDWPYSRNDFVNLVVNDGAQSDCNGDGSRDAVSANDITLVASDGRGYADYAEVSLDCIDALCEEPVWVDANCSLVGWSLDSDTFFFEGDACLKIINTYTVIDWCQYNPNSLDPQGIWTWTVVGKLVDPFPPVVTADNGMFPAIPGGSGSVNPTTGACVGFATASAIAFDTSVDDDGEVIDNACPSQWLKWNVYVDIGADWVFDREWSSFVQEDLNNASDPLWSEDNAADNIAAYGYTIPDVRVGNRGGVDNATDFATEPNFEYTINIPDAIPADCGETQHRVVWKVYDGCGNVSSTTSFFTVSDMKAPTPYCVNLSTALMADPDGAGPEVSMVELWAIDFDFGSFDNCTEPEELRFTFTDTPPSDDPDYIEDRRSSARAFTCDDLAGTTNAVLTVPVYVWDGCDNFDFCLVNLRLIDNNPEGCTDNTGTGSIAGTIVTEFGETVENVEVTNEDMMDLYEENKMTDDNGDYAFDYALMSHDFEVSATKNDDYLNGVSTLDLVIIQRHILGSAQLDSPYKMIAADVNNDKAITAIDLIQLRKLILGIYDELPNNSSWRFADASTTIDATNPWNTIDETINIYNLTSDMMDENFVGIKVGDVNQSVVANLSSTSTESRSASSIDVLFEDRAIEVGELVELVITGESINDLYGYQFTLETEGLELVEVESGLVEVTNANFGALGNKVTTSWNTLSPINANGDLFTMTFKSNVSGQLSEILDLNSSVTRAEAYVGDNLEILNIDLRNGGGDVNYALYQNEPNPFSDKTIVGFDIPEAGAATLTVLDVTGKVLRVINGDYAKGYNELELSKSDFGSAGVYYYQLDSGDYTATKKMIIIE
jgi:subtilisin-like proprotein convertase family protein